MRVEYKSTAQWGSQSAVGKFSVMCWEERGTQPPLRSNTPTEPHLLSLWAALGPLKTPNSQLVAELGFEPWSASQGGCPPPPTDRAVAPWGRAHPLSQEVSRDVGKYGSISQPKRHHVEARAPF